MSDGADFELLARLAALAAGPQTGRAHEAADAALIAFIDDPEIAAAYEAIGKWYD